MNLQTTMPWRRSATFVAAWIGLATFSLWLRMGFPVHAIGHSGLDDALFIRLAQSLQAGLWLGPYDNATLAKGMFYPLFIAIIAFLAISLRVAEHVLYLAVAALAAGFLQRRTRSPWLGLLVFAILALNPALWSFGLARVVRENLYISLSLALVVLTVIVAFPAIEAPRRELGRAGHVAKRLALSLSLGLVATGYWLTREEGIWLLPSLGLVLLMALVHFAWRARLAATGTASFFTFAVPLVLAGIVCGAGVSSVAWLNKAHYGIFETSEFKSRAFRAGYGALSRLRHEDWRRLVVLPRDARLRAYAASPAARELEPFFEGAGGEGWRMVGCVQSWMPDAAECPEILGGWFMWALRDATTAAGYGGSATAARDFYLRLAAEIDGACRERRLECLPVRETLAPPFRQDYLAPATEAAGTLLRLVLTQREGPIGSRPSTGSEAALAGFSDAVGPIFPSDRIWRRLQGWVGAVAGPPRLILRDVEVGQTVTSSAATWNADYIRGTFPGMHGLGFALESDCLPGRCELFVTAGDTHVTLPWDSARLGMILDTEAVRIFGDRMDTVDTSQMSARRRAVQLRIANGIANLYAFGFPVLAGLGVVGLALALLRHRRRPVPMVLLAFALAALGAVAARVILLAYLDATTIPSTNLLYVSPAIPFAMISAALGTWLGLCSLQEPATGALAPDLSPVNQAHVALPDLAEMEERDRRPHA
jgi:hypothetical protein